MLLLQMVTRNVRAPTGFGNEVLCLLCSFCGECNSPCQIFALRLLCGLDERREGVDESA